jgi:hypothetical protein
MRVALPLLLVAGLVVALAGGARGEDPISLDQRMEALQREVTWLRGREARLSAYVIENEARADGLEKLVAELRTAGFASHAQPTASRELLLRGLSDLARSLKAGVPVMTEAERNALASFSR